MAIAPIIPNNHEVCGGMYEHSEREKFTQKFNHSDAMSMNMLYRQDHYVSGKGNMESMGSMEMVDVVDDEEEEEEEEMDADDYDDTASLMESMHSLPSLVDTDSEMLMTVKTEDMAEFKKSSIRIHGGEKEEEEDTDDTDTEENHNSIKKALVNIVSIHTDVSDKFNNMDDSVAVLRSKNEQTLALLGSLTNSNEALLRRIKLMNNYIEECQSASTVPTKKTATNTYDKVPLNVVQSVLNENDLRIINRLSISPPQDRNSSTSFEISSNSSGLTNKLRGVRSRSSTPVRSRSVTPLRSEIPMRSVTPVLPHSASYRGRTKIKYESTALSTTALIATALAAASSTTHPTTQSSTTQSSTTQSTPTQSTPTLTTTQSATTLTTTQSATTLTTTQSATMTTTETHMQSHTTQLHFGYTISTFILLCILIYFGF
ncbi:uncharacterized protein RJT21DRAFT_47897 [Scheffersomyces amazonensis]|uniref:uncharacterized protein n=1 Tax=Scheffersomyces amazonensis TaxID=1078765 RepID=UPI00315C6A96